MNAFEIEIKNVRGNVIDELKELAAG